MPIRRAFKTDESFLEKIAIGAVGTRRIFDNLREQGHEPIELERGSMSFKIWKAIKIKRVRVPDILCLRCGQRVESRAKTKIEITMSHSLSDPQRGWDYGLQDRDVVALVRCSKTGTGPIDWTASGLVQYARVRDLREAWNQKLVVTERPKGAQEGFEVRVTWPSGVAPAPGIVTQVTENVVVCRRDVAGRPARIRLIRRGGRMRSLVQVSDHVEEQQILASVVAISLSFLALRERIWNRKLSTRMRHSRSQFSVQQSALAPSR